MKVVIIGGGIAGLTLGILLRKKNIETVINERLENMPVRGPLISYAYRWA